MKPFPTLRFLFILFLTASFLPSCIGTKKLNRIVSDRVKNIDRENQTNMEFFEIHTDSLRKFDSITRTTRQKYYFIPLIVVSFWNASYTCELNSRTVINSFAKEFKIIADSMGMISELSGKKLRVYFDKSPQGLVYNYKGYNLSFGYFFFYMQYNHDQEQIFPFMPIYRLRYELIEGDSVIIKGNFSAVNPTKPISSPGRATRTIVWRFIDNFYSDIALLNRSATRSILKSLRESR